MAVTSPYIYTIGASCYDLRRVQMIWDGDNSSRWVLFDLIDIPIWFEDAVAFDAAYQTALDGSTPSFTGSADFSDENNSMYVGAVGFF